MKTFAYFTSIFVCLVACSADKKPGNSPYFADDATLTVSGQFLDKDEKPLAARNIVLKNLRRFAYFDPTLTYFKESLNWFAHLAFPMFPSYELSYDSQKAKPNYFIKNVVTANDGSFRFQMRADQTMRDSEGGINITLVNDGEGKSASYAKYNFVIKAATSTLDPIHLCSLGDVFQEGSDSLNWTWTTPTYSLDHYEFRFADAQDNSLLWTSRLDATENSLKLPKAIFRAQSVRYAVEIFYHFEDQKQLSCLTPSQVFSITQAKSNLAQGKLAQAENIKFKITSLSNDRFNDESYFAAYDSRWIILDLLEETSIGSIHVHNLQFADSVSDTLTIEGAHLSSPNQFESLGLDAVKAERFASYNLPTPSSWARIRISSLSVFDNLQEITIQAGSN